MLRLYCILWTKIKASCFVLLKPLICCVPVLLLETGGLLFDGVPYQTLIAICYVCDVHLIHHLSAGKRSFSLCDLSVLMQNRQKCSNSCHNVTWFQELEISISECTRKRQHALAGGDGLAAGSSPSPLVHSMRIWPLKQSVQSVGIYVYAFLNETKSIYFFCVDADMSPFKK